MNQVNLSGVVISNSQTIIFGENKYNLITLYNKHGKFSVAVNKKEDVFLSSNLNIRGRLSCIQMQHKPLDAYWGDLITKQEEPHVAMIIIADKVSKLSKPASESQIVIKNVNLQTDISQTNTENICGINIGKMLVPCQMNNQQPKFGNPVQIIGELKSTTFDKNGFIQYIINVESVKQIAEENKESEHE